MEINYLILNNAPRIILLIHFNPHQWSICGLIYNPLWLFQNCQLGYGGKFESYSSISEEIQKLYGKLNTAW
jgi:hypothetical protein